MTLQKGMSDQGHPDKGHPSTVCGSMGEALASGKPVVLTSAEPGTKPKVIYRRGTEREALGLLGSMGLADLCPQESWIDPPKHNLTVKVKEAMSRLGASLECEREMLLGQGRSKNGQEVGKVDSRLKDLAVVERALRVLGVE